MKASLLAFIGVGIVRLLTATLRIRIHDHAGILGQTGPPAIWLFWHNRLFLMAHLFERHCRGRKPAALTSASKDGAILAAFIERFHVRPIRGSSSRRGAAALLEMIALHRDGYDIGITPDGPRGPRYSLNPGVVRLAQKTGAPVLQVSVEFSRCYRLGRWDGFMIPAPFACAEITLHEFYEVKQTATPEEFEDERQRLEESMLAVTETK